jgi:hypothetical protein
MTREYAAGPIAMGLAIAALMAVGIVISVRWTPQIWNEAYRWVVQLVFFSLSTLLVLIGQYWRFRKRPKLWAGLGLLATANAVATYLFIDHIRRLVPAEYVLIVFCEVLLSMVFIDTCVRPGYAPRPSRKSGGSA